MPEKPKMNPAGKRKALNRTEPVRQMMPGRRLRTSWMTGQMFLKTTKHLRQQRKPGLSGKIP